MFDTKNTFVPHSGTQISPTFFGKVMSFFALALLSSAAGAYVTYTYWIGFFVSDPWIMYALFALELVIIFTSRLWSTKKPLNRLMFAAFTFITGVTIAPLLFAVMATAGGTIIVTKALIATAAVFIATAVVGWTTNRDLSGMGGFLLMALIGMIVVSVIGIFIPWSNNFEIIFSGIGILLFSAFTVYDFQQIKRYPEDRYIDAALRLYLDIFNLFMFILRLLLALNRR